jgi:hypothetical protein
VRSYTKPRKVAHPEANICYTRYMDLNIRNFPEPLLTKLKLEAIKRGGTLRDLVISSLENVEFRWLNKEEAIVRDLAARRDGKKTGIDDGPPNSIVQYRKERSEQPADYYVPAKYRKGKS